MVTNTCASLIDNMYSNIPINTAVCNCGILEVSISDHYLILALDNLTHIKINLSQVMKRCFCNKNIDKFKPCLNNQSLDFMRVKTYKRP